MKTREIHTNDVRPGDRVVTSFGICTVRGIKVERQTITLYWHEPQPAVTQSRSQSVTVVKQPLDSDVDIQLDAKP